jgi:plastocyanin
MLHPLRSTDTPLEVPVVRTALFALAAAVSIAAAPASVPSVPPTGKVIEVKMVAFSPAKITVKAGDVVRFTQVKANVHNVEFKTVPTGANLGALMTGPFLMTVDQVHEFTIDARFTAGTYDYVCTPHSTMGMTGQIVVTK